ncbi:MAG: helix-turn-helix transcriptional regulator [Clostridia bacterium]|nr:helix-turn-helix transcriptional regulator [Clostridia bacterium]
MAEVGISQRSLAKALGCSKNTINSKINGKSAFSLDDVDAVCAVLGITDERKKVEIFLSESCQK